MRIEDVNSYASYWTMLGWFLGLVYFNWFSDLAFHVPLWAHVTLGIAGMFAASIIIGGGLALLARGVTKLFFGKAEARTDIYAWAAFISPVLAFFAASYALSAFRQ